MQVRGATRTKGKSLCQGAYRLARGESSKLVINEIRGRSQWEPERDTETETEIKRERGEF